MGSAPTQPVPPTSFMHSPYKALVKSGISLSLTLFVLFAYAGDHDHLNVANPDEHPFVDPAGNREGHLNADIEVNEFRVYDFYQRQADFYMSAEHRPAIVPAFPGLDAGLHGHWGKHNQNQYDDDRWNDINMGPIWGHTVRRGKFGVGKAIAISLGSNPELSVCFDPETFNYPTLWEGGFVSFDPFRWGTSRNALPNGEIWFENTDKSIAWSRDGIISKTRYRGYYRHNGRAIFSYDIDGKPVLDSPTSISIGDESVFIRILQFPAGFNGATLSLGALPDSLSVAVQFENAMTLAEVSATGGLTFITIPATDDAATMTIAISQSKLASAKTVSIAAKTDLSTLTQGGPLQWPHQLTVRGSTAADENLPYVIDTITIPQDTGFQSVMQLTSIGFLENGTALVATLAGEMWAVSGLSDDLLNVTWKRFAAGLNQPMGIHIDEDGIFVMERGQITRLHDLNNDGEADFYETWANDFDGRDKSHSHSFGLVRGDDGSFYFTNWKDIYRTGPDRVTDYFAHGVRNSMGVGSGVAGSVLVGPQEGTFTPASMVIDVHEGEFYGHPGDKPSDTISPPLCFIPRGIDNSTGGFLHANNDRWGPINDHTIGFSFGYSSHYLVLRDSSTSRHQGATVPLSGDFQSGVMRGAFGPHDGQLYLTGIDGWGDYSVSDGSFQRVRYTGKLFRDPIGFQVHSNGIRIDFASPLDSKNSAAPHNVFVQQWNYEYAPQYGSPEFSQRQPHSLGHDVLNVRSVKTLNNGSSIFVEIPKIETVMQMHLRLHLTGADGVAFKTDLFPSIIELGKPFEAPGLAKPITGKATKISLRVRNTKGPSPLHTVSGEVVEGERAISLDCDGALQFSTKVIEAKTNEPIKLVLKNSDIMPHNAVFVTAGNLKKVGELSFSMLNDPKAVDKHYTPDVPEVIAGTFIVQPGGSHTLHFTAPSEPGDHHFVCTFPGHWMTMNGIFRVSGK